MSAVAQYTDSLGPVFSTTESHTSYDVYSHTHKLFPNKQQLFVDDCTFHLYAFLQHKSIPVKAEGFQPLKWVQGNRQEAGELSHRLTDGVLSFTYEGTEFEVFRASWESGGHHRHTRKSYHFVFSGEDDSAGKNLIRQVYTWQDELKEAIWEYSHGWWGKSAKLYQSIQGASWDDVLLQKGVVESLKSDTETFFASEAVYEKMGIAWKRGILLLGPPGNGKTQTIQALIKDLAAKGIPSLYVKTFQSSKDEEWGVSSIFAKAREEAPCLLIIEDLDAMLQPKVKSYFLNELDGLARNHGILTIATSNHPEEIDDAILRRPSRFDQKYVFELPSLALREEYATKWLEKVQAQAGFHFETPVMELAKTIAEKTDEWSFAFLKELFVSFLLRTATDQAAMEKRATVNPVEGDIQAPSNKFMTRDEVLLHQVEALAEQVKREGKKIGDGTKDSKEEAKVEEKAE